MNTKTKDKIALFILLSKGIDAIELDKDDFEVARYLRDKYTLGSFDALGDLGVSDIDSVNLLRDYIEEDIFNIYGD